MSSSGLQRTDLCETLFGDFRELMFRAEVALAAPGTLPRFEMKARRIVIKPEIL